MKQALSGRGVRHVGQHLAPHTLFLVSVRSLIMRLIGHLLHAVYCCGHERLNGAARTNGQVSGLSEPTTLPWVLCASHVGRPLTVAQLRK